MSGSRSGAILEALVAGPLDLVEIAAVIDAPEEGHKQVLGLLRYLRKTGRIELEDGKYRLVDAPAPSKKNGAVVVRRPKVAAAAKTVNGVAHACLSDTGELLVLEADRVVARLTPDHGLAVARLVERLMQGRGG